MRETPTRTDVYMFGLFMYEENVTKKHLNSASFYNITVSTTAVATVILLLPQPLLLLLML